MLKDILEEKRLLYLVQTKKDPDAFAELYRRYIEKIYRFIFFKIGDRANSEDIASDVFLKTWNYLSDSERLPVESFSGFVYQIARNAVVDWYRGHANTAEHAIEAAHEMEAPAASSPNSAVENMHDLDRTYRAIKKLKQEYQEVVHLRYIDELSIGEIAVIMGKGHTSVRVTLHRAMKKLREVLDQP